MASWSFVNELTIWGDFFLSLGLTQCHVTTFFGKEASKNETAFWAKIDDTFQTVQGQSKYFWKSKHKQIQQRQTMLR